MTNAGPPPPDTSEMLAVHQIFRNALGDAERLVGSVAEGDAHRAGLVADFYQEVLTLLDLHHKGEDELVWPKLLERAPGKSGLVRTAQRQHEDVHETLDRAGAALDAWKAAPGQDTSHHLISALRELEKGLMEHLESEERNLLAVIGAHLTIEEWGELPAHAMRNYPGERIWLPIGLVRENMTQAQRDNMLAHMPPPVVEMWTTQGEAAFNAYMAEVRGG
jgi:hemerythrin-like domain-containing protein